MFSVKRVALVALALLALGASAGLLANPKASAANFDVAWADPVNQTLTVSEGDTVTFNFSGFHNLALISGGPLAGWADVAPGIPATSPVATFAAGTGGNTYVFNCSLVHPTTMTVTVNVQAVVVDAAPPTVNNTAASPNPTNGAASVTLTADVADDVGVVAASYTLDGGAPNPMSVGGGVASATVGVGSLAPGAYIIVVSAEDAVGNVTAGAPYSLNVSEPPAGSVAATVSITGGGLANTAQAVSFGTVALTGNEIELGGSTTAWSAVDARGSGAGWNVTITSTDFSSSGGSISTNNFRIAIAPAAIVPVGTTSAPPTTQVASAQPIPLAGTTPLKVLSAAAGNGMGQYDYTPDFALTVPASAAPGDYTANMTVSINSGP